MLVYRHSVNAWAFRLFFGLKLRLQPKIVSDACVGGWSGSMFTSVDVLVAVFLVVCLSVLMCCGGCQSAGMQLCICKTNLQTCC